MSTRHRKICHLRSNLNNIGRDERVGDDVKIEAGCGMRKFDGVIYYCHFVGECRHQRLWSKTYESIAVEGEFIRFSGSLLKKRERDDGIYRGGPWM